MVKKRFKKVVVYKSPDIWNQALLSFGVLLILIPLISITTTAVIDTIINREPVALSFFMIGALSFIGFGIYQLVTRKVHYEEIK